MAWEARHSVSSKATPAAVWALWSDPGRWPEWNEQLESVELNGPFEVGSEARIKLKRGGNILYTIVALEPEELLVTESRLPGARLGHEHRIEPGGGGIEISNRVYLTGPLSRLYALMMGRQVRKRLPELPQRERELAESDARSVPRAPRRGSRRR